MPDIKTIADKADIIINGYAFTRKDDGIHVLNLNSPDKAVVFNTCQGTGTWQLWYGGSLGTCFHAIERI